MRQAGVVAAAGVYALDNCVQRLADDHRNAKKIGQCILACKRTNRIVRLEYNNCCWLFTGIHQMSSSHVTIDPDKIETNILILKLKCSTITPTEFYDMLLKVIFLDFFLFSKRKDVTASLLCLLPYTFSVLSFTFVTCSSY